MTLQRVFHPGTSSISDRGSSHSSLLDAVHSSPEALCYLKVSVAEGFETDSLKGWITEVTSIPGGNADNTGGIWLTGSLYERLPATDTILPKVPMTITSVAKQIQVRKKVYPNAKLSFFCNVPWTPKRKGATLQGRITSISVTKFMRPNCVSSFWQHYKEDPDTESVIRALRHVYANYRGLNEEELLCAYNALPWETEVVFSGVVAIQTERR